MNVAWNLTYGGNGGHVVRQTSDEASCFGTHPMSPRLYREQREPYPSAKPV